MGTGGAEDGDDGQGYGAGIFIMGDENIVLAPGAGETLTIANQISDQSGSDPFGVYGDPGVGGVVINGAGTVVLSDDNAFFGGVEIEQGTLVLASTGAAGYGAIKFDAASSNAVLEFAKVDAPGNTINNFWNGDEIEIDDFTAAGKSYDGTTLTLGGVSLDIPGLTADDFVVTTKDDDTFITSDATPCYARGTLILTDRGETPVEGLSVGDRVMTASGEAKPIKWLGHRRLDLTKHRQARKRFGPCA